MIGIKPFVRLFQRQRRGPYRLLRLFLNFYVIFIGAFVAIAFSADYVISRAQHERIEEYARRFMQGTITMITTDLDRYPVVLWSIRLQQLQAHFSYRLRIFKREEIAQLLPQVRDLDALDEGDIVVNFPAKMMYQRLGNTPFILAIGPFSKDLQSPEDSASLPLEERMRLLTWSLMAFLFAVVLYFWLRPIVRDLENMRQAAALFGTQRRDIHTRVKTNLFAPLSIAFNSMIRRIDELLQTHKELTSSISHELRTPMARIRFALEMLGDNPTKEESQRFINDIARDLDELDTLIDANLTYSRMERGTIQAHFEPTPLATWLTNEVEKLRVLAHTLDFKFVNHVDSGVLADLDLKLIPYAIRNLLRNAFKYAKSQVLAECRIENDEVVFSVDDDGIGIAPADREKIFAPFTRLDRSRDRATGGYGLGLAITKRAVYQHAGAVLVEESPLGGARFVLRWPLHLKK